MSLATLVPGAPVTNFSALDIMTGLGINTVINGSRNNVNLLTVDGGFNMDSGSNNSQISNVGVDFIEQVTIKTSNFSAEFGQVLGGVDGGDGGRALALPETVDTAKIEATFKNGVLTLAMPKAEESKPKTRL